MGAILSLLGLGKSQETTKKVTDYGKKLEKRVAKKQKKTVEETKKAVIEADKEATTKKKAIDDDLDLDDVVKDSMKKEVDTETAVKKKIIADNAKAAQDALKAERVKNAAKKADLEERLKLLQAQRDEAIKKQKAAETREKEAIKAAQDAKTVRKNQEKAVTKTTAFLKDAKAEEKEAKKRMHDMRMKCRKKEERSTDVCRSVRFCNNPMNAIRKKSEYRDRCKPLFEKLNIPKSMLKKLEQRIRKLKNMHYRHSGFNRPKRPRFNRPKRPRFPEFGHPKRPRFPEYNQHVAESLGRIGAIPKHGKRAAEYRGRIEAIPISDAIRVPKESRGRIEEKMDRISSLNRSRLPHPYGEFEVFIKRFDFKLKQGRKEGVPLNKLVNARDKRAVGMIRRNCNTSEAWRRRGGDICRSINEIIKKYN